MKPLIEEITSHGCLVNGPDTGLVDFPCLFGGEIVLLCWRHHRLVHHGWQMTGEPNDQLTFIAPDGTKYTSRPPPRPETLGW